MVTKSRTTVTSTRECISTSVYAGLPVVKTNVP